MQPPESLITIVFIGGTFMWLHLLLAAWTSFKLRRDEAVISEVFSSPVGGGILPWPHLVRIKFYLPWVTAPKTAKLPTKLRYPVFAARLCGFVFICCVLALFAIVFGMVI